MKPAQPKAVGDLLSGVGDAELRQLLACMGEGFSNALFKPRAARHREGAGGWGESQPMRE